MTEGHERSTFSVQNMHDLSEECFLYPTSERSAKLRPINSQLQATGQSERSVGLVASRLSAEMNWQRVFGLESNDSKQQQQQFYSNQQLASNADYYDNYADYPNDAEQGRDMDNTYTSVSCGVNSNLSGPADWNKENNSISNDEDDNYYWQQREQLQQQQHHSQREKARSDFCQFKNGSKFLSMLSEFEQSDSKASPTLDQLDDFQSIRELQVKARDLSGAAASAGGVGGCVGNAEADLLFADKLSSQPDTELAELAPDCLLLPQQLQQLTCGSHELSSIKEEIEEEEERERVRERDRRLQQELDNDEDHHEEEEEEEDAEQVAAVEAAAAAAAANAVAGTSAAAGVVAAPRRLAELRRGCQMPGASDLLAASVNSSSNCSMFALSDIADAVERLQPEACERDSLRAMFVVQMAEKIRSAKKSASSAQRLQITPGDSMHTKSTGKPSADAANANNDDNNHHNNQHYDAAAAGGLAGNLDLTAADLTVEPSFNLRESFMRSTPIPHTTTIAHFAGQQFNQQFSCPNKLRFQQVLVGECDTSELAITNASDMRLDLSLSLVYCAEEIGNTFVTLSSDEVPFSVLPRVCLEPRTCRPALVKFSPRRMGFYLAELQLTNCGAAAAAAAAASGGNRARSTRTVRIEASSLSLRLITQDGAPEVNFGSMLDGQDCRCSVQLENIGQQPATVLAMLLCDSGDSQAAVSFPGRRRDIQLTVPPLQCASIDLQCHTAFGANRSVAISARISIRMPADSRELLSLPVRGTVYATHASPRLCSRGTSLPNEHQQIQLHQQQQQQQQQEEERMAANSISSNVSRLVWAGVAMETAHTQHVVLMNNSGSSSSVRCTAKLQLSHANFSLDAKCKSGSVEIGRRTSIAITYSAGLQPGPHTARLIVRVGQSKFHIYLLAWAGAPQLVQLTEACGVVNCGWPAYYWIGQSSVQGVLTQGQSVLLSDEESAEHSVQCVPAVLAEFLRTRRALQQQVSSAAQRQLRAACSECAISREICSALTGLRLSDTELRKLLTAWTQTVEVNYPNETSTLSPDQQNSCNTSPSKTMQVMDNRPSLQPTLKFELRNSVLRFPEIVPGQEVTEKVTCINRNHFDLSVRVTQPQAPFHLRKASLSKFTLNQRNTGNYPFVFRPSSPGHYTCEVTFSTAEGDVANLKLIGVCSSASPPAMLSF